MAESPSALQWLGIGVVIAAFYAFSFVGKLENIHFRKDKWVACIAVLLAGVVLIRLGS